MMLVAENLCKTYNIASRKKLFKKGEKIKKIAVKNVSLKIVPGMIVGLLGVNGAGKTTTIKMLTTILHPSKGIIDIDGIDAINKPMEARKIINLITGGERNLYWRLTAKENLEYFGSLYGLRGKKLQERINDCLVMTKLEEFKDIPVEKYSKGMKQRLQIARGLVNDPLYLFLDEPTLGLDILVGNEFRKYIKELAIEKNKGILFSTHYMEEADQLCDYIYLIDNGEILVQGSPIEIKNRYAGVVKQEFVFNLSNMDFINSVIQNKAVLNYKYYEEKKFLEIWSEEILLSLITNLAEKYGLNILNVSVQENRLENAIISALGGKRIDN